MMATTNGIGTRIGSSANAEAAPGPRATAWAAYAACAWALLFTVPHVYWAVGGTAGLQGHPMSGALRVVNLASIPLSLLAALVALAMVRSWGRAVPRWLLGGAAWGACAVLGMRGGAGLVQNVLGQAEPAPLFRIFEPGFLVGGILFGAAAWYHGRSPRDRRSGAK
jgi:uncharacterized membrane protein